MERRVGEHDAERGFDGATNAETAAPASGRASTIGRAGAPSAIASAGSSVANVRAVSRSRTITANGFSTRPFRSRSRATAASLLASQVRW